MTCAQHANGRDWWLIQNRRDTVLTYLIDPSGINLQHEIIHEDVWESFATGMTKFNSQGNKFSVSHIIKGADSLGLELIIADFDRCSGLISNIQSKIDSSFYTSILGPGLEFSNTGRYLYYNNSVKVFQYDTWASDVFSTQQIVAEYDGYASISPFGIERETFFSRMQRAPAVSYTHLTLPTICSV